MGPKGSKPSTSAPTTKTQSAVDPKAETGEKMTPKKPVVEEKIEVKKQKDMPRGTSNIVYTKTSTP